MTEELNEMDATLVIPIKDFKDSLLDLIAGIDAMAVQITGLQKSTAEIHADQVESRDELHKLGVQINYMEEHQMNESELVVPLKDFKESLLDLISGMDAMAVQIADLQRSTTAERQESDEYGRGNGDKVRD